MKKTQKLLSFLFALMLVVSLAACGNTTPEPKKEQTKEMKKEDNKATTETKKEDTKEAEMQNTEASGTVVVYSPHDADPLNDGINSFMEKYPNIKVEVVAAGTGELINRIKAEAAKPIADVLWGGGADSVVAFKEFFEPYVSANDAAIPAAYKDPNHIWTGESPLPMVLFYNKELLEKDGMEIPKTWSDLLKPEWKGKIAYCSPAKSGSAYTQLCTMLYGHGGKEDGWKFIKDFYANLDGKLLDSSSKCHKMVADGEYHVGLTLEKAAVKYANNPNVGFVYPEDGTSAVPDGVALVKNAPNPDNAKLFIDFVTSVESQERQSQKWGRRPAREDVEVPEGMSKLNEIKLVDYDFDWAANNKEMVIEKFNDIVTGE